MSNVERKTSFRLERVLEHRRRQTESAQQNLAVRARERVKVEQTLDRLQHQRSELMAYLERNLGPDGLDLDALVAAEAYESSLRTHARRQQQEMAAASAREAEARARLLDRRVAQQVLEKLKERSLREAQERERAAESRLLDEIATTRGIAAGQALPMSGARHDR